MAQNDLQALFHPKSIAIIGASDSPAKIGHEILKNLQDGGFPGTLYPINPKSERILDLPCFKNVKDIPDPVDMAVVIIPARFVPQTIRDCGEKGVKAAIIITGGFSEAGEDGEKLQKETAEVAREYGVRLIGPNCQGINNPYEPMCASWPLLTFKGGVAVIAQSGTVGAAMMDWFSVEELGVSCFVSMGNRADVDETDLIEYFENDPNTKVIALYLEGLKDPLRFQEVVQSLTKPLVVLKSGRTPGGKVAAESHTKSLAGADATYDALFQKHGICRAQNIQEFYDFAKAFACLKPPQGNRILFITTSGGAAILATDAAEQEGLVVSPLPSELAEKLEGVVPPHAIRGNPLDLTGDANAEMFRQVIELSRPYYDTLGVIFGDPIEGSCDVVKPGLNELIIYLGGAEVEREERLVMHRKGVPVFQTPERGIRALSQVIPKGLKVKPAATTFPETSGKNALGFYDSMQFMDSKGFQCIPNRFAGSAEEAVQTAHQVGFPVALKIDSPDLLHKTDVGGVKLDLQSGEEVEAAYVEMITQIKNQHPEARVNGATISAMASPGLEVIMGMNRDEQFGPIILFGLGGVMVELFRDVSLRLLPFSREDAVSMLHEIKGASLLSGYRGKPAIDENALVEGLLKLARIAEEHADIMEIDLNPVFAYTDGMVVVDARIIKA